MRIFEIVKENVNLREAAELYGIDVNRYSKALCPFHNDRHPSLYVADDHFYCSSGARRGPRQRTAVWNWPVTTATSTTAVMPSAAWRSGPPSMRVWQPRHWSGAASSPIAAN